MNFLSEAVIKHNGRLYLAYQEVYKRVNIESARHGGSDLWRKKDIRSSLETLRAKGLGLQELAKKLKESTEP